MLKKPLEKEANVFNINELDYLCFSYAFCILYKQCSNVAPKFHVKNQNIWQGSLGRSLES